MNQKKHMKFFLLGSVILILTMVGINAFETPTFKLPQFIIDYEIKQEAAYLKEKESQIAKGPYDLELLANMININTATAKDFDLLPGIGPVTAESIVAYREKNGKFLSINQLIEVERIGEKTLEKIRPYVTLGE